MLITDFLSVRTFDQLRTYCTDLTGDEQASSEAREEARRNLNTITKPVSPTTSEDDEAVKARVIDFLARAYRQSI